MINNMRIASPCSADWEQMPGDDRVRHCHACNLNVYNLSAFTEREIRALVANREGRLCARLYRRSDGTVLTRNCPVGLRVVTRRISRVAGAILSFLVPNFGAMPLAAAQSYTRTNVNGVALQLEVVDPSGALVSGADVTLTEASRNQRLHGKTDKRGRLALSGPLGGRYALAVSAPGLEGFPQTVELRSGEVLTLTVTMHVGALMGDVVQIEPPSQPDRNVVPLAPQARSVSAPRPMQR
jgi:Carboxypeptidase regulatory-like domain